jgi:hypothetical protein
MEEALSELRKDIVAALSVIVVAAAIGAVMALMF